MPAQNPYEESFKRAKDRFRQTGVGGVSLPSRSAPARPGAPQAETTTSNPASKNVIMKNGIIMIGGPNVKTRTQEHNPSIKVFDYGKKEAQKDNKNNGTGGSFIV
jgi:hypothetical protein